MKVELENVLNVIRDINNLNGFRSFSAYTECYTRIKNLPTIPDWIGEWITDKNGIIKCSQCLVPLNEFQANFGINNYCPACGVRMKRRNKNEN